MIKCLATQCKNRIRQTDIIGRYGGEEFLVLLPDTNLNQALFIAEDLCRLIGERVFEFDNQKIQVNISIGVTSTSSSSEKGTLTQLINDSDKALYQSKNTGRNRVCAYVETRDGSMLGHSEVLLNLR